MSAPWQAKGQMRVAGVSLEYACWGPRPSEAPTLVLLHEGLGCVALWRDVPERLAAATGFGVMAYSRAGYGGSDPVDLPRPLDYMTREAMEVLPDVLNQFAVDRAVLVGHSDGATIATIHAGSVQDRRVRGVVALAPHFFTEPEGLAEIAAAKAAYERGDLKARLAKYHRDPDTAFWGWNDAWLHPDFASWDVTEVIDYLRVPVLAIQGRDDPYGTLTQIDTLEERSYAPVDRLILEGCGHAPHLERPEAVIPEIAAYCARLERIEAAEPELG